MGYGKSKSCMMYLFNMIKEGPTNIYTIDQMTVISIFSSIVSPQICQRGKCNDLESYSYYFFKPDVCAVCAVPSPAVLDHSEASG
jgi:hypothetical protein